MKKITQDMLTKWRRELHQIPELSLVEFETKKYIQKVLEESNIEYSEVLDTGLIVQFKASKSDEQTKTILFRADIDALPIQEANDIEFKSQNPGVMHACGHDGHTTILLGTVLETAEFYKNNEVNFNTMFVFQPAEETIGGAGLLVRDYAEYFASQNIEASYALHLNPDYPENTIISREKEIMASATEVVIKITGQASHVGLKHRGRDALNVASVVYQELLKLNTMYLNARETNIIHIGKMSGGDAPNIVAKEALLEGTIRTYSTASFDKISEQIKTIAKGLEVLYGVTIDVEFSCGYPAVINDTLPYELIKNVVVAENIDYVELPDAYLFGEDFSFFSEMSPINYSFLGIRNEEKNYISGLHTPTFNFDENILMTGVKYFLGIVKYYNNQEK